MLQLFSRNKKEKEPSQQRVMTAFAKKEEEVSKEVEAGLYPARVASRKGVKLAQFALNVAIGAVVLVALLSIFGLIDPIRKFLQPIQMGTGQLVVSSEYTRAQVSLDGKVLGQTPFTSDGITAGTHTLKVQAADNPNNYFVESEINLVVNPGNSTVVKVNPAPQADLFSYVAICSANRGTGDPLLEIKALPTDASIVIDGNSVGSAPYENSTLSAGSHQVMFEKDGYRPTLVDVTIATDKTVSIDAKLYQYQMTLDK